VDLLLGEEQSIAIVGASGTGKSTLLHLLAGLDQPTAGHISINGVDLGSLNERARSALRNRTLGFVYQFHHLLPEFTAEENVAMPLLIRRDRHKEALSRAQGVLRRVGLEHRLGHKPGQMSGGERQRTAIARAVVGEPTCLLADEPTGNLDQETAADVQSLLFELNQEHGTRLVLATHDLDLAHRTEQVFELRNGILSPLKG
jgi:lipoprotein-releasing system ATP-binding protein|tara:strand:- start:214 stop:819 length:606 start_codon:yes stop_codon:yes gene_type:complete